LRKRPGKALKSKHLEGKSRESRNLRIYVSPGVGFCSGVKRAIKMALAAAAHSPQGICSYGPLIHNPQVVEKLREVGIRPLARFDKRGGLLVIRSHGVSPAALRKAKRYGYKIVDATCQFVRKAQENAKRLHRLGYEVVIVGEKRHPEVKSIRGCVPARSVVVEDAAQAKRLKFRPRVGIIAQTTIPVDTFASVVSQVARETREVLVFNTICSETARRQERARKLAGEVDILLVVGGRNSANTSRLENLCRSICTGTHQIETAREIDKRWFRQGSSVGIVTGASTPKWLVDSIVHELGKL
jgi:4-hydroxy-3-methylbut-2-enyl diphosphate reductase